MIEEETFTRENEVGIKIEYSIVGKYIDDENKEYRIYTNFTPSNDSYGIRFYVDEKTKDGYKQIEGDHEKKVIEEFHREAEKRIKNMQNSEEKEKIIQELKQAYEENNIEEQERIKKDLLRVIKAEISALKHDLKDVEKIKPPRIDEQPVKAEENKEKNKLIELEKQLAKAEKSGNEKEITACRGRVIRELKSKIKSASELELNDLKQKLEQELENHKKQIDSRYKAEYKKPKKTFKSILTVLPVGIALAFKKVAATIEELKLAKTNKEKTFKSVETAKDTLKALGTPVDFTVRFAANHWYLLLLLLSLKIPPINPNIDKNPNTNQDTRVEGEQVPGFEDARQEQLALRQQQVAENQYQKISLDQKTGEHAVGDVREEIRKLRKEGIQEQKQLEQQLAQQRAAEHSQAELRDEIRDLRTQAEQSPITQTVKEKVVEHSPEDLRDEIRDLRAQAEQSPIAETTKQKTEEHATEDLRDEIRDLRAQAEQSPVAEQTAQAATENHAIDEAKEEMRDLHQQAQSKVEEPFHFEEGTESYEVFENTINRFNERTNGRYYVREIADNKDVQFYETPEDYLRAICEERGDLENINQYIDPATNEATELGYEEIYRITRVPTLTDSRTSDIIFSDPSHKYLEKFQEYGFCKNEYEYFSMETRGFETVDDLATALKTNDPVNNQLREDFTHCLNVSEAQDAINALQGMGEVLAAGSVIPGLTGLNFALPIEQLAASPEAQSALIELFMETIKVAPEIASNLFASPVTGQLAYAIP